MGDVIVKWSKHQYIKSFIHNVLLHYVLTWWLALCHLDALLVLKNPYSVMVCSSMLTKTISAPESFLALITGKNNAFQMVSFNVIFYGVSFPFFPAHFTLMRFLMSSGIIVLAFFHHRLDPLFKLWLWKGVLHIVWVLYYVYIAVEVTMNMAKYNSSWKPAARAVTCNTSMVCKLPT